MRDEYNFSHSKPSPYPQHRYKQVSLKLDLATIEYFQNEARNKGVTLDKLLNKCLTEYRKAKSSKKK